MVTFITRRVIAAFFIVLGASFLVFILMANAGDPLAFLVEIQDPTQRENLRRSLTEELNLDVNPVVRYFMWLGGVFQGDFGISTQTQQPVLDDLANRVPLSLKLITASLILAVLIGIVVGIVTAIKQYSGFDYIVDVLHVRVLRPAGVLGRRDPQRPRRDQLQRLAARRRPLRSLGDRAVRARRGRARLQHRGRPPAAASRVRRPHRRVHRSVS